MDFEMKPYVWSYAGCGWSGERIGEGLGSVLISDFGVRSAEEGVGQCCRRVRRETPRSRRLSRRTRAGEREVVAAQAMKWGSVLISDRASQSWTTVRVLAPAPSHSHL